MKTIYRKDKDFSGTLHSSRFIKVNLIQSLPLSQPIRRDEAVFSIEGFGFSPSDEQNLLCQFIHAYSD